MTDLRIQTNYMSNCEDIVRQAYYEWGRGWKEDSSAEPSWDSATTELRSEIGLRGYGFYDGWKTYPSNVIGVEECYVSTGINSRVILYDIIRFLRASPKIQPLLAQIPPTVLLEDNGTTSQQISSAATVVNILCDIPKLGLGKTTKVLHKKRPGFIPVVDSVVRDFFVKNFPHVLSSNSNMDLLLSIYRETLIAYREPMETIRLTLALDGYHLTMARLLSILIWSTWKSEVDSSGFGPPITVVWDVKQLAEAKKKAAMYWNDPSHCPE